MGIETPKNGQSAGVGLGCGSGGSDVAQSTKAMIRIVDHEEKKKGEWSPEQLLRGLADERVDAAGGLLDRPRGRRATPHHAPAYPPEDAVAGTTGACACINAIITMNTSLCLA